MRRVLTIAAVACACAGLAACGGDDEDKGGSPEAEVRKVVKDYLTALGAGNDQRACGNLSPEGQKALVEEVTAAFATSDDMSCREALRELAADIAQDDKRVLLNPEVGKVSVNGSMATAEVRRLAGPVPLRRVGDRWRVERSSFEIER